MIAPHNYKKKKGERELFSKWSSVHDEQALFFRDLDKNNVKPAHALTPTILTKKKKKSTECISLLYHP